MPDQDVMTIDERRKYLHIVRPRYKKADRQGRGVLLDEMQLMNLASPSSEVTGLSPRPSSA